VMVGGAGAVQGTPAGTAAGAGGVGVGVFGAQLAGAVMGTPAMPAAPHNTPVGPGGSFGTPGAAGQQQQSSPSLSTASRVALREQGLQQIRQQLMAGIGGRPEAPSAAAAAAAAAPAASPVQTGGGAAAADVAPAVSPAKFAAKVASMLPIQMSPGVCWCVICAGGEGGREEEGVSALCWVCCACAAVVEDVAVVNERPALAVRLLNFDHCRTPPVLSALLQHTVPCAA
jgi:hypothetical protein